MRKKVMLPKANKFSFGIVVLALGDCRIFQVELRISTNIIRELMLIE
jgi:hypothetical protein